ncbi:MAG: GIY-YIG nuclease family protein [bacterium]|nr:GIY-YIG nuclease family protein [bacterium]
MKQYFIYILASKSRALYTGVTSDLERRTHIHKSKSVPGFTAKYKVHRLVYFEETNDVHSAIAREKQIKSWRRSKKVDLIEAVNPTWEDLSETWNRKADSSLRSE